jgi:hypothetical protein
MPKIKSCLPKAFATFHLNEKKKIRVDMVKQ